MGASRTGDYFFRRNEKSQWVAPTKKSLSEKTDKDFHFNKKIKIK